MKELKRMKKFIWILKNQYILYPIYYWETIIVIFYQFVNNFSALLLCKMNVFNNFNTVVF